MNKLGIVFGVAAVAMIAGCKDPNWQRKTSQDEVKGAGPAPVCTCAPGTVHEGPCPCGSPDCTCGVAEPKHCTCPPGTKHSEPCGCGADDCQCVVVKETPAKGDAQTPVAAEPEHTVYIVQRGDYLAKISKKYNVTISSIKRLNNLKDDKIRIGQKLKLPGKVEVGEQKVPEGAFAKDAPKAAKPYAPYAGATKEYVVKSGDTLGAIAYGNGINIRQLKELNGLSGDSLKVGQKLKIPAEKVVKAEAPAKTVAVAPKKAEPKAAKVEDKAVAEPVQAVTPVAPVAETGVAGEEAVAETVQALDDAANAQPLPTYTVQEGDDLTDVSIRYGVSAAAVRELNNLGEADKLVPGMVLKLPADAQQ